MENNRSKRKIVYLILSILVAVGCWFFVDTALGTEATITIENILVEYVGEETALMERGLLLLDDSDQYVTLQLRAKRSVIAQLNPDEVRIQADLSGITDVGEQSVKWDEIYPSSEFSESITVIDGSPYTVTVNIGELHSKEIPIRYEIQGVVAEGYSAGAIELSQETMEVRGLEEDVEQVSYAMVTLEIDEATRAVTRTVDYVLCDEEGNEISETALQTSVETIDITMPVNVTKQLRLVVDFVEAPGASVENVKYTISPSYITVSGDAEMMESMNVVALESFDLLDLSGNMTYNYVITLPDGVENLSGYTRATMEIAFIDMKNTTVMSEGFVIDNVPDGKIATVVTTQLGVRIFGATADVDAITTDDIVLRMDMSDYGGASGTYTVAVTVELSTDGDIGLLGTYQAQVNLTDEIEEEELQEENEDDTSSDG